MIKIQLICSIVILQKFVSEKYILKVAYNVEQKQKQPEKYRYPCLVHVKKHCRRTVFYVHIDS